MELPSFIGKNYEQTDIIITDNMVEAIYMYKKSKIDSLSFKMAVRDFESMFYSQLEHTKSVTPQFYLELEELLHKLYNSTKEFSTKKSEDRNYFKETELRILSTILESMSYSNTSIILSSYYSDLDVKSSDHDYNYSLEVYELLVDYLNRIGDEAVPMEELKAVHKTLSETGNPFKRKDIRIGLRSATNSLNALVFNINERLLEIDLVRDLIKKNRKNYISNTDMFSLMTSIKRFKTYSWLSSVDYPYVLGDGYVEVLPTKTYRVKQYGKFTGEVYKFTHNEFQRRSEGSEWIYGSYHIKNNTMITEIGRYATEMEVFRLTDEAYLLGSKILLME